MQSHWRLQQYNAKVKSEKQKVENDLKYRCYRFSLQMIKFLKSKKWDSLSLVIVKQLMRSSVSVGANVTEAKNSSSRLEFKRYYEIALKSANESKYWICLLRDGFDETSDELKAILKEADELSKILAASIIKLKKPD
jgi:four helix bundle protein